MSMFPPHVYRRVFHKDKFYCYIVNGSKGEGKSTWIEYGAEKLLKKGYIVMDLWGAGNFENCFWCIPGIMDKHRPTGPTDKPRKLGYPVMIIVPKSVTITPKKGALPLCTCGKTEPQHTDDWQCKKFVPLIMTVTDDTPLSKMLEMILYEKRKVKRVLVFNEGFYLDTRDAYKALTRLLKELQVVVKRNVLPSHQPLAICMREVADLVTGGVKAIAGTYATETRRQIQTIARKIRHYHTQALFDAQRNDDIAAAVADQKDYLIIKKATDDLIPLKYQWVIDKIERYRRQAVEDYDYDRAEKWPRVNQLKKNQYYVVFPDNSVELRYSRQPGFMHKGEYDYWDVMANVDINYGSVSAGPIKDHEQRIEREQEKTEKLKARIASCNNALALHENDKLTWLECAKKVGYLDDSGKPNEAKLKMDIVRFRKKGWIN